MGNTCGSCSFDNRGSEFDMEPKDKYVNTAYTGSNPPIRLEESGLVSEDLYSKQQSLNSTKEYNRQMPVNHNYENKENDYRYHNRVEIKEEIIHKEIISEPIKKAPTPAPFQERPKPTVKNTYEEQEYDEVIEQEYQEPEFYDEQEQIIEDNQEVDFESSFEYLQPPYYDCPEVMRIREENGAFNYEIGPYADDYADGQHREKRGLTNIDNDARYQGEWIVGSDVRDGRGFQIWPDGSLYEGYWRNNKANGRGRLIHADGDVYEGEWKDDKADGLGVYSHADGARYEGNWLEDKQHGKGVERWPDGAVYDGNYHEGQKHGEG